jgi:D-threo-aldose 1-dehydrogenase
MRERRVHGTDIRPTELAFGGASLGNLYTVTSDPTRFDDGGFVVPGDLRREWDFSRSGVMRSVEASLGRLGDDHIDILYLHDPDASGIPDAALAGAAALIELREEGVVSAVRIGSNSAVAVGMRSAAQVRDNIALL